MQFFPRNFYAKSIELTETDAGNIYVIKKA